MLLSFSALRSIFDDLGEGIQGRDPQKKKCTWCGEIYDINKCSSRYHRLFICKQYRQ